MLPLLVMKTASPGLLEVINENGFARAFGGDGGTCECRGDAPPDPPSVGDVTGFLVT